MPLGNYSAEDISLFLNIFPLSLFAWKMLTRLRSWKYYVNVNTTSVPLCCTLIKLIPKLNCSNTTHVNWHMQRDSWHTVQLMGKRICRVDPTYCLKLSITQFLSSSLIKKIKGMSVFLAFATEYVLFNTFESCLTSILWAAKVPNQMAYRQSSS